MRRWKTLICFDVHPVSLSLEIFRLISISFYFFLASASSQLIVHSSKVRTPQRHNSESVLYMNDEGKSNGSTNNNNSTEDLSSEQFQHRSSRSDNRLFPINTYTEQPISLSASTTSLDSK